MRCNLRRRDSEGDIMRKYHKSNWGDCIVTDDIVFSESMTQEEFARLYNFEWNDGRIVSMGDSEMEYVVEVKGRFVITGLNVDVWDATIFEDIEGFVWESYAHLIKERKQS